MENPIEMDDLGGFYPLFLGWHPVGDLFTTEAQCGLSPEQRFTFYDHVHTTGALSNEDFLCETVFRGLEVGLYLYMFFVFQFCSVHIYI